MNEEIIFEAGSALAGKIIEILKTRDSNELFMAQFADIPEVHTGIETEEMLIDRFGDRRLKDLELYTEDPYLPSFGVPGSKTKLCMDRDYTDDDAVSVLSRAFPEETIRMRYYGESTVPFWETYTVKAGKIEFSGFEDDVKYSIFKTTQNFREKYSTFSAEDRGHRFYLLGATELKCGIAHTIEDLTLKIEDCQNRYPGEGIIATTEQEVFFRDESGKEHSKHISWKYYTEEKNAFFELDDAAGEIRSISEDDLVPELPQKKQFPCGGSSDEKNIDTGKRSVYQEWHRQETFTQTSLEIIIPDCTPALHKELYEELYREEFYDSGSHNFHYKSELNGPNPDMEKLRNLLISKSLEYPEDEIWLSKKRGSDLPCISHIMKGRLHEIKNARTEIDLEIPSNDSLSVYLEKVFSDPSYMKRRFNCTGEIYGNDYDCYSGNEEKADVNVTFRFKYPGSLSTGILLDYDSLPESPKMRIKTSFGSDVPLFAFNAESKRERRLSLDVMFCPAVLTFPEKYKAKLAEGYSPDSFRFREDLANDGAMMPMTDDAEDTLAELLQKTESIRHEVSGEFESILLDISRKRDSLRMEKHTYLFSPDYDTWYEMDKYNGELTEINILEYFKKF